MESFLFALNGVLPLFVPMSLGYAVRRLRMADPQTFIQLNRLVFHIFLPLLIYLNIYRSDLLRLQLAGPIVYALSAIAVIFFAGWAIIGRMAMPDRRKSVLVQALFRSNYVLFGVPLAQSLLPNGGSGMTELFIAIVIPVFNLLAVFILQYYGKGSMRLPSLLGAILKNPLIVASLLGLITVLSGLELWPVLERSLDTLARVATPLALFALGGQFYFTQSRRYLRPLMAAVAGRLLLVPILTLGLAIMLGFRGEVLISYLALFGGPVAVSSYTMTQQMDAEHELAGQILVYTSICCIVSLFLGIFFLRHFSLI